MAQIIPVAPFDYVVFGGTGDLATRKLLPALFHRDIDGQIPEEATIFAISRRSYTAAEYADFVQSHLRRQTQGAEIRPQDWARFLRRLRHVTLDAGSDQGWENLARALGPGNGRVRVFYLATSPQYYGTIARRLAAAGLAGDAARLVVEKPIGSDLSSARRINDEIGGVFDEGRIYRIDHYLGKEAVQNLLALRFANSLFEPLWNSMWIDHVQISVSETVGLEGRAGYYDGAGAVRDMVQNHLLQLVCLVAMEPPQTLAADAVRDEKLKVLRSLGSLTQSRESCVVRGQYVAGAIDGSAVPGYADELGGNARSRTETYVAMKLSLANWRWAGVPFYVRTGKRMARKASEIVVQFKPVPHSIFGDSAPLVANRLIVRLQPDEGITLRLMTKEPGPGGLRLRSVPLDLSFAETFSTRFPEAYERLLMDVVRGNTTLFMRRDEVEAAWSWIDPSILEWERSSEHPKSYVAGSWGPSAATALIERDGRTWHEELS
ncbi:glucose-6-phosphate dehydrogenase [Sphingomonas daechungensis]|uniref:glucose-6-phosphate dehydrogenase n=1 Tax=Sphingomonas daechungensis TaxID=1176646 RepID=UPI0037847558